MTRRILILVYLLILGVPVMTWVKNGTGGGMYSWVRLAGLLAFTLIFLQLTIGSLMLKLRPIFGAGILKVHIVQGLVAFVLAWLHPALLGWERVRSLGGYYNWGKVGLVLLTAAVMAGLLRTRPWLARYWRWVHRLNYLTLAIIYIHSWNVGSDVQTFPMLILYWLIPLVLLYNIMYGYNRYFRKARRLKQAAPAGDADAKEPVWPADYRRGKRGQGSHYW